MSQRPIPRTPPAPDGARRLFDEAVKERLEVLSGVRGEPIKPLPATASSADVIAAVNAILGRLQ